MNGSRFHKIAVVPLCAASAFVAGSNLAHAQDQWGTIKQGMWQKHLEQELGRSPRVVSNTPQHLSGGQVAAFGHYGAMQTNAQTQLPEREPLASGQGVQATFGRDLRVTRMAFRSPEEANRQGQ